nr:hypothetical protein [Tanacetum cinerariifolium]
MEDHTSDWLRVILISGLGKTMNGKTYCCVMCYRVGIPLFSVSKPCSACLRFFNGDIYGDHVVSYADFVPGHGVIDDAQRKRGKYMAKYAAIGYVFLPFSFSSLGELEADTVALLKQIQKFFMAQDIGHGRMILESVEHGPLIWPAVEENSVIRTKKYAKLSAAEKIQADCDMKATNIILQGLPADIYSLVNHHRVVKDLWERVQLLMQGTSLTKQERERYDPIAYLNKAMAFLTVGRQGKNYSGTTYKGNATSSRGNTTSGQAKVVKCYNYQGERHMARQCTQPKRQRNAAWCKEKEMLAEAQEAGKILDEEQLTFLADPGIPAEVPNSETYLNDMDNQSVHALQDFEQSPVMDFIDNEISSDSNIIPYS